MYYPKLIKLEKYCYDKHKGCVNKDKFFDYIKKGDVERVCCCAKKYEINLKKFMVPEGGFKGENALMYACFVN